MQYMLLVYGDENVAPKSEAEGDALFEAFTAYTADLRKRGTYVGGSPLAPPASATTVRSLR